MCQVIKYVDVGVVLRVDFQMIKEFEENNPRSVQRVRKEIIQSWLDSSPLVLHHIHGPVRLRRYMLTISHILQSTSYFYNRQLFSISYQ